MPLDNPPSTVANPPQLARKEIKSLKDLSKQQWRSGIAAWLGWLFDGLDMHLYTIVAATFVMQLVNAETPGDPSVKKYSAFIQAAFLVGWALGGAFFGRIGDKLGRSRALSLTILTYALFTGLSCSAQTWWHLMIFRFLAALGIGGEWAVGSSLLSETWPKKWRPWIAAVLQTGVNIGILLASVTGFAFAGNNPRYIFVVGVLPALLVFWIRKNVPEPDEWHKAKASAQKDPPVSALFKGAVRRTTILTILVCSFGLTGWWAFMFWNSQYLRSLPELVSWTLKERDQLVATAFFLVIFASIFGNFFAGWLALKLGYRRAIAALMFAFSVVTIWTYAFDRTYSSLITWSAVIGFCSGVFGLFTMYMPPLFPTLLRTTGAGFCYNIGRIAAAAGTVVFGLMSIQKGIPDLRIPLFINGFLFIPATLIALILPEPRSLSEEDHEEPA
jgi:MFS family permease